VIKKAIVLNDTYVFNNPWSIQANEKHTTYCAMMRLGLRVPDTWMLRQKPTSRPLTCRPLCRALRAHFDLGPIGGSSLSAVHEALRRRRLVGVRRSTTEAGLRAAYAASGTKVMHLQSAGDSLTNASSAASASGVRDAARQLRPR